MAKNKQNPQNQKQTESIKSIKKIEPEIIQQPVGQSIIAKYTFAIFALCLILTGFFIFKDYLLGKAIYLFKDIGCDGLNVTYPNIVMISDYFKREGMPSWTFTQGMGQNIYPFWLDQFLWILSFIDKNAIPKTLIWVNWLELLLSGFIFRQYLRTINVTKFASIIGGLCYAYCAYAIAASGWANRFAIELFNTALLLLALEMFLQKKSWWLLPIPIALLTIDQPFNLYPFGIFILGYTCLRYAELHGKPTIKLATTLFQIALISTLGVMMASFIGFSNILQMIESPRVSGSDSYSNELLAQSMTTLDGKQLMTWITRMFSNDLLGTGSEFRGWSNYFEAPMFYVGLLALVAIPQLFNFLNKRQQILYGITLGLCFLPMIFPFFRYAFWAFTGDYYRTFSLFFGVVILRFGMQAISFVEEKSIINKWMLLASIIVPIILLALPYSDDIQIDKTLRIIVIMFLILNALLLFGITNNSFRNVAQILLLLLTCVELIVMSSREINPSKRLAIMATDLEEKTGYNDYTNEAVDYLKKNDKSFFRIQKNYTSTPALFSGLNDSRIQIFYGTQSYNSFNQMNYVRFMRSIDVVQKGNETTSRWVSGVPGNIMLLGITNVKYLLSNSPDNQGFKNMGLDSIQTVGNIKILKNRFAMPLGFTYDSYTTEDDFDKAKYSAVFKSKAFIQVCVVDKSLEKLLIGLKKITQIDTSVVFQTNTELPDLFNALKADSLQITKFSETNITGNIDLKTKKILYLSIPFDRGWHATVDGKEADLQRVQWGLTGLVLDKGIHKIELSFTPPFKKEGTLVSLISLGLFGVLLFVSKRRKQKEEGSLMV
jgi:uncharacterized membrane protein YfhO